MSIVHGRGQEKPLPKVDDREEEMPSRPAFGLTEKAKKRIEDKEIRGPYRALVQELFESAAHDSVREIEMWCKTPLCRFLCSCFEMDINEYKNLCKKESLSLSAIKAEKKLQAEREKEGNVYALRALHGEDDMPLFADVAI